MPRLIAMLVFMSLVLINCDYGPVRYGTVVDVNETGVKVEWEDGTVESRKILGAAFIGDKICEDPRGASTMEGACRITPF